MSKKHFFFITLTIHLAIYIPMVIFMTLDYYDKEPFAFWAGSIVIFFAPSGFVWWPYIITYDTSEDDKKEAEIELQKEAIIRAHKELTKDNATSTDEFGKTPETK